MYCPALVQSHFSWMKRFRRTLEELLEVEGMRRSSFGREIRKLSGTLYMHNHLHGTRTQYWM
jgi:hypothetical protein